MSVADTAYVAEQFVAFCDGLEDADVGLAEYALRGRVVARMLVDVVGRLEAERSARVALKARCEAQQELLGRRVLDALEREARR